MEAQLRLRQEHFAYTEICQALRELPARFEKHLSTTRFWYVLTRSADDQFFLSVNTTSDAQALAVQIQKSGQWLDVVPGIDSVTVRFDAAHVSPDDVEDCLRGIIACGIEALSSADTGQTIVVPVAYGGSNGPDLKLLCETLGISESDFVALHTAKDYPVELVGFMPGFAFIGELQPQLRVPRRSEPRQSVPAGSVAIADSRTGLYALSSPGGWNIVGKTPLRLFDPLAVEPFLLSPGMRVRFVPTQNGGQR